METKYPTNQMQPHHPDKYISMNRQQQVANVRDILLGRAPRTEQQRDCCKLLEQIYDLRERAAATPILSKESAVMLRSIMNSLDAMSANIVTSLGMKSSSDIPRTTAEMEARLKYYDSVLPVGVSA